MQNKKVCVFHNKRVLPPQSEKVYIGRSHVFQNQTVFLFQNEMVIWSPPYFSIGSSSDARPRMLDYARIRNLLTPNMRK